LLVLVRPGKRRRSSGARETGPGYHDFTLPRRVPCLDKIPVCCQPDVPRHGRATALTPQQITCRRAADRINGLSSRYFRLRLRNMVDVRKP
jgi:hypothetical protein